MLLPALAVMVPSRHLWLGNVTQKPSDEAVLEVFSAFGKVRVLGEGGALSMHCAWCALMNTPPCFRNPCDACLVRHQRGLWQGWSVCA